MACGQKSGGGSARGNFGGEEKNRTHPSPNDSDGTSRGERDGERAVDGDRWSDVGERKG
jgi:hypothetical protein